MADLPLLVYVAISGSLLNDRVAFLIEDGPIPNHEGGRWMPWGYVSLTTNPGRILAGSAVLAIALLLALMLHVLAAGALGETGVVAPPAACQSASPATEALADGDDVRARFLADICGHNPKPHRITGLDRTHSDGLP